MEADHLIHWSNADRSLMDSLLTLNNLKMSSLKDSLVDRDPYDSLDKGSSGCTMMQNCSGCSSVNTENNGATHHNQNSLRAGKWHLQREEGRHTCGKRR